MAQAAEERTQAKVRRMQGLPRRVYPFRALGMGLALAPILVVLDGNQAPWPSWAWACACALAWPHAAWLLASRSRDRFVAERRNLIVDSAIAGSMVPLMAFNVLPSVLLLVVATADKINTGIRGLWLRSLSAMAAGIAATLAVAGFAWQPHTGMPVVLASLPLMVVHALAVSLGGYRLIRTVQAQNRRLDEIIRIDALTGLHARAHWQSCAESRLREHAAGGAPASLMLVDVDQFKGVNDRHGHAVGDDVLRAIAATIRDSVPAGSQAGRLGGDEFAVVVPLPREDTGALGERVLARIREIRLPGVDGLACSASLGVAAPPRADASLRDWFEAADRALYLAKDRGRGRVELA